MGQSTSELPSLGKVVEALALIGKRGGLHSAALLDLRVLLGLPAIAARAHGPSVHDRAEALPSVLSEAVEVLDEPKERDLARALLGTDPKDRDRTVSQRYLDRGLSKTYYYGHRASVLQALGEWLTGAGVAMTRYDRSEDSYRRERRRWRLQKVEHELRLERENTYPKRISIGIRSDLHALEDALTSESLLAEEGTVQSLLAFSLLVDSLYSVGRHFDEIHGFSVNATLDRIVGQSPFDMMQVANLQKFLFAPAPSAHGLGTAFSEHVQNDEAGRDLLTRWERWVVDAEARSVSTGASTLREAIGQIQAAM